MKRFNLEQMKRGWFVGNFVPTVLQTEAAEVAYRPFKKGQQELLHYHKVVHEVTLITEGEVRMAGEVFAAGEIIVLEPGEQSQFEALTDGAVVIVKLPSVPDDKYVVE